MIEVWNFLVDLIMETESTLKMLIETYGLWFYVILFLIIFCETGLVVTPFLPGDSLLFVSGVLVHSDTTGQFNILMLNVVLIVAAILGDACNYTIGRFFGEKLFSNPNSKIFKQSYLEKTHHFYEKHGGKTIIIARFVPIVRTFAPFVAGMGKMTYHQFFSFNVIGGIAWVAIFTLAGYFVGELPWVQTNLKLLIVIIVVVSILPGIFEVVKAKIKSKKESV
ncbi:membrane-associated protein [Dysgonomonas sp. PH5-45]|uniref:DedA family protein n=1 Tax=unclassified Dysgonomonas TaxID=2630389 RepID=UPI0024751AC7|nr:MULTISPECIES: DedA family protein [unclassified Dysgonomonas]MDH6354265.1 membrane-associated protein [Dysgonomonas sp. PH5-45]MDH6387166.1 membrane-associated protein [Dysgonomonas sp. PH5-37]